MPKQKDNILDLTVKAPTNIEITNSKDESVKLPLYPNDGEIEVKAGTSIKLTVTSSRELAFYYTTARTGLGLSLTVLEN